MTQAKASATASTWGKPAPKAGTGAGVPGGAMLGPWSQAYSIWDTQNRGKRTGVRKYPKASPGCASAVRVSSVCNAACDVWRLIDDCVPCVVPGHDQFCHCVEKGVLARDVGWCRPSPPHGNRQGSGCLFTLLQIYA